MSHFATQQKFYDDFIDFIQHPETTDLNGGSGLMESFIGIDYSTLVQNSMYSLKPPASQNEYIKSPGVCVKRKQGSRRLLTSSVQSVVFDNNVPGVCTGSLATTNRKTGANTGTGTINFNVNGDGTITGNVAYTSGTPTVEG